VAPAERREEAGANQRVALNIVIRDQNQYATPMTKMLRIARNKISRGSLRTRTRLSISSVPWASALCAGERLRGRAPHKTAKPRAQLEKHRGSAWTNRLWEKKEVRHKLAGRPQSPATARFAAFAQRGF
jgi:hypothetical protein